MKLVSRQSGTAGDASAAAICTACAGGAGYASLALLFSTLGLLVQAAVVGMGSPSDPGRVFAMLHGHRIEALLRLELPTMLAMPMYYLVFLGLFAALRCVDLSNSVLATCPAFIGNTLVLATPTALPLLPLGQMYAAASSDSVGAQYLAAGQAIMAIDKWHHTSAANRGVLLQAGAVLICVVMLRGGIFGGRPRGSES